jgi:uncharacterized protein with ParB-like and HNH nuclease domain
MTAISNMSYNEDFDVINAENIEEVRDEDEKRYYGLKREQLKTLKIKLLRWSINDIYQKYQSGNLNLQPFYQRKVVWKPKKQTQFIESLLIDITTPPIYIAQINDDSIIGDPSYEVVDGQQRLTAILTFFGIYKNQNDEKKRKPFTLVSEGLVYYRDLLGDKTYDQIKRENSDLIRKISSYTIDFYMITRETHPDIKYDIFARLNQDSVKLSEAELRRSIYYSELTTKVSESYTHFYEKNRALCNQVFSATDRDRFNDYNRMFKSFAFYSSYDNASTSFKNYNARPREMINELLESFQRSGSRTNFEIIDDLISFTVNAKSCIMRIHKESPDHPIQSVEYFLDTLVPFCTLISQNTMYDTIKSLNMDPEFRLTFERSAATTSNVNRRLQILARHLN